MAQTPPADLGSWIAAEPASVSPGTLKTRNEFHGFLFAAESSRVRSRPKTKSSLLTRLAEQRDVMRLIWSFVREQALVWRTASPLPLVTLDEEGRLATQLSKEGLQGTGSITTTGRVLRRGRHYWEGQPLALGTVY